MGLLTMLQQGGVRGYIDAVMKDHLLILLLGQRLESDSGPRYSKALPGTEVSWREWRRPHVYGFLLT